MEKNMTHKEAVNLISEVLKSQRLTILEHTRLQEAWRIVLEYKPPLKEPDDGVDAVHLSGALQQSQ